MSEEKLLWGTLFCASVAFALFMFSVMNRKRLGLTWSHPRIWVEFIAFATFMAIAIYIKGGFQ